VARRDPKGEACAGASPLRCRLVRHRGPRRWRLDPRTSVERVYHSGHGSSAQERAACHLGEGARRGSHDPPLAPSKVRPRAARSTNSRTSTGARSLLACPWPFCPRLCPRPWAASQRAPAPGPWPGSGEVCDACAPRGLDACGPCWTLRLERAEYMHLLALCKFCDPPLGARHPSASRRAAHLGHGSVSNMITSTSADRVAVSP